VSAASLERSEGQDDVHQLQAKCPNAKTTTVAMRHRKRETAKVELLLQFLEALTDPGRPSKKD
jgi:hypothetical protein